MIRNITYSFGAGTFWGWNVLGTLIFVGLNKISPDNMAEIINSKDRKKAGKTAGASGLCLMNAEF